MGPAALEFRGHHTQPAVAKPLTTPRAPLMRTHPGFR
jgi:hypothetical protein